MRLLNLDITRMRRLTNNGYDLNKLAPSLIQNNVNEFYTHSAGK